MNTFLFRSRFYNNIDQIKGVDSTKRSTKAKLKDNSTLVIKEKIMTHGKQFAETSFDVDLDGEGCGSMFYTAFYKKSKNLPIKTLF